MGLDKFGGEDDQASSDDVVKAIEVSAPQIACWLSVYFSGYNHNSH